MRYRQYGKSAIKVSEVGLGTWQLGNHIDWSAMSDGDAIQLVKTAYAQGCNFFDTAPGYGRGNSERLLGEALIGIRDQVVINTKVGHTADGLSDFSPEGIRRSVEESMQRLKTSYLDSVILHNPPSEYLDGDSPQMKVLQRMQDEGMINAYGASVDTLEEMHTILNTSGSSVIEVLYNLFFQETAQAFAQAELQQVGIIIKVPLDSGWLSGKYNRSSQFTGVRARWTPSDIERRTLLVEKIRQITDATNSPMAIIALRFILAQSAVSTVIPGSKNIQQWELNASASQEDLDPVIVQQLRDFWTQEIAQSPIPW